MKYEYEYIIRVQSLSRVKVPNKLLHTAKRAIYDASTLFVFICIHTYFFLCMMYIVHIPMVM